MMRWENLALKLKPYVPLFIILGIYYLFSYITGIDCFIQTITGIACPACGLTRAYLSLCRLDLTNAFYCHPLFPIILPAVVWMLFGKKPLLGTKIRQNIFLAFLLALVLAVWILRLFFIQDSLIFFDK